MKNDETLPDTADTDLVVATHTGQQRVSSDRTERNTDGTPPPLSSRHQKPGKLEQFCKQTERADRCSGMFLSGCFNSVSRWETPEY